jgi:hypothetical protein
MVFVSDFYVIQVEGSDWEKAARFKLCESLWTKLGQPFWVEREQLTRMIADGFMVEVLPEGAETSFGRRVLLVRLDDKAHFRVEGVAQPGSRSAGAAQATAATF